MEPLTTEQEARLEEVYALQREAYQHGLKSDLTAAFALKRRALALEEHIIGVNHPDTAVTLKLLASDLYEHKQYTEAEELLRRALAIYA